MQDGVSRAAKPATAYHAGGRRGRRWHIDRRMTGNWKNAQPGGLLLLGNAFSFSTLNWGGLRLRKINDTATPHCAVRTSPAHDTRWCGARASVNPRSRWLGDTPVVASAWPLPALQQPLDEQGCLRKRRRLAHLNAGCTNGAQLPPNSGGGQEKNAGGQPHAVSVAAPVSAKWMVNV